MYYVYFDRSKKKNIYESPVNQHRVVRIKILPRGLQQMFAGHRIDVRLS